MKKFNKYPLQKRKKSCIEKNLMRGCLLFVLLISIMLQSGCTNKTLQFLEAEMEQEEIVQLTPGAVQREPVTETDIRTENNMDAVSQTDINSKIYQEQVSQQTRTESQEVPDFYVYVCGAVVNPGVYEMAAGSRVFQAVEQAGGFTEEAAPEYVNQAMEVADGQQIYIPSREEMEQKQISAAESGNFADKADSSSGKVNINTADKTELMTISGIGESRAQDIINYRQNHGGFSTIEEIMDVPGIKEATFEKIKECIEVK